MDEFLDPEVGMTNGVNYHQLLKKYMYNNAFIHNIRLFRERMQVLENGSALPCPCFFNSGDTVRQIHLFKILDILFK